MRSTCLLLLVSATTIAAPAFAAIDDRNFTGTWVFQPDRSELNALPQKPDREIKIVQDSAGIHWFVTGAEQWKISLDGHENVRRDADTYFSSMAKWEGAALLISTNVSAPNNSYSLADRWKLARDGQSLLIHRKIIRGPAESESTLVYQRGGAPNAPPTLQARAKRDDDDVTPRVRAAAPVNSMPPPDEPAAALVESPRSEPRPSVAPAATDVPAQPAPVIAANFVVANGTHLPLRLLNSVSTKHSAPGDHVYLETIYPILSKGRVIIPPGSYVEGSLTEVKRPGRVKGKSELFLRFDSLTLPNGVTRDFRARLESDDNNTVDRKEGKVVGESGKGQDAKTIATATAAGTGVGVLAGAATGHLGMGAGIGAAAGALGGLASVLATRGPDAVLQKGSTVEMVLDRDLVFTPDEVPSRPRVR